MATIYEANTIEWSVGDYVVHDDDAKRADMLMVVIGRSKAGIYRTRYAFPEALPRSWRQKVWRNSLPPLHDPRRFGIKVPTRSVSAPTQASAEGRASPATLAVRPIAKS